MTISHEKVRNVFIPVAFMPQIPEATESSTILQLPENTTKDTREFDLALDLDNLVDTLNQNITAGARIVFDASAAPAIIQQPYPHLIIKLSVPENWITAQEVMTAAGNKKFHVLTSTDPIRASHLISIVPFSADKATSSYAFSPEKYWPSGHKLKLWRLSEIPDELAKAQQETDALINKAQVEITRLQGSFWSKDKLAKLEKAVQEKDVLMIAEALSIQRFPLIDSLFGKTSPTRAQTNVFNEPEFSKEYLNQSPKNT